MPTSTRPCPTADDSAKLNSKVTNEYDVILVSLDFRFIIFGLLSYLAPEYAENGTVSARTDVYAYGVTLIQLISGRRAVSPDCDDNHQSLRQWAEPLVEKMAMHDLIDPRLEDSYDPYELYHMAKTAYLCVKLDPEKRPSMGEVVKLLEGESEHFKALRDQFITHFNP